MHVCSGGIRTMMVTGDYHHTGIAVARDVGMLKPQGKVVVIDTIPLAPRQSTLLGATSLDPRAKGLRAASLKSVASSAAHRSLKRSVSFALGAQPSGLSPRRSLNWSVSFAPDVTDSDLGNQSDGDEAQTGGHANAVQARAMQLAAGSGESTAAQQQLSGCVQTAAEEEGCARSRQSQTPLAVVTAPHTWSPPLEGLRFLTTEQEVLEPSEALHALAEGRLQCAVTGEALEHLLQHHDLSVLESVMQNAVVFSRMKPHQKGQVVDLLGMPGIHQMFQGHARYIPVGSACCSLGMLLHVWP